MIHGDSTDCRGLAGTPSPAQGAPPPRRSCSVRYCSRPARTRAASVGRPGRGGTRADRAPARRAHLQRSAATLIDDVGDSARNHRLARGQHAADTWSCSRRARSRSMRPFRQDLKVLTVDAAFDGAGQLHVLAGLQHLVRAAVRPVVPRRTPRVRPRGLDTFLPRFVAGGTRTVRCCTRSTSRQRRVGAPARWDWYGVGGSFGAGIIWPWRTRGSAPRRGAGRQWALRGLVGASISTTMRTSPTGAPSRIRTAACTWCTTPSATYWRHSRWRATRTSSRRWPTTRHLLGTSRAITSGRAGTARDACARAPVIGMASALGFNAATRELLLVRQHHGAGYCATACGGPRYRFDEPRLGTAGATECRGRLRCRRDRQQSRLAQRLPATRVLPAVRDGRWSAPVEIADAASASFFGSVWGAVRVANDGIERVFVTWPVSDGIEARWLRVR